MWWYLLLLFLWLTNKCHAVYEFSSELRTPFFCRGDNWDTTGQNVECIQSWANIIYGEKIKSKSKTPLFHLMQNASLREEKFQTFELYENPELFLLVLNMQILNKNKYLVSYHTLNMTEIKHGVKLGLAEYRLLDIFLSFTEHNCTDKVNMLDFDVHCHKIPRIIKAIIPDDTRTGFRFFANTNEEQFRCFHYPALRYMEIDIGVSNLPYAGGAISVLSKIPRFSATLDWMFILNSVYLDESYLPEKPLASYFIKTSL